MRRTFFALILVPAVVLASSITPHSLQQRADASDRVALVQVLSRQTLVENGDPRKMTTVSRLAIAADYKGEGPQHVNLVQLGGKSGLWELKVAGDADLPEGTTAVVFLKCPKPDTCSLVALGAGALVMADGQLLVPDLAKGTVSRQTLPAVIAQLKIPAKPQVKK